MAFASMVTLGYSGDLLLHWFWWDLVMVPFCFVVFQLVRPYDQIECPSLFWRSHGRCEDQPCVKGDWFVAGCAHQVTADAGAEVKAFNDYQETLDASFASTNAAIEAERLTYLRVDNSSWILSQSIPLATMSLRTTVLLSTRTVPCARKHFHWYTATCNTSG